MAWKMSTYGCNETLDLGVIKIVCIWRSGTKDSPLPDSERYEFDINGATSKKKFGSAEECKRIAMNSALNKLNAAVEALKKEMAESQKPAD